MMWFHWMRMWYIWCENKCSSMIRRNRSEWVSHFSFLFHYFPRKEKNPYPCACLAQDSNSVLGSLFEQESDVTILQWLLYLLAIWGFGWVDLFLYLILLRTISWLENCDHVFSSLWFLSKSCLVFPLMVIQTHFFLLVHFMIWLCILPKIWSHCISCYSITPSQHPHLIYSFICFALPFKLVFVSFHWHNQSIIVTKIYDCHFAR